MRLNNCAVHCASRKPSGDKLRTYTLEQAERRIRYWQRILRLTEWTFNVSICRALQLDTTGKLVLGDVSVLETKKIAHVRLLDSRDFLKDGGFVDEFDHELTIIHELLHVRLHGVADESRRLSELAEEHAVHAISLALGAYEGERCAAQMTAGKRTKTAKHSRQTKEKSSTT